MNWKDSFPKENKYFETDKGILYLRDCLEIMKMLPDKIIDLILTDPPYGIGADKGVGGFGVAKNNKYNDNWDNRPKKELFDTILSISKKAIIFGGNYFADLLPRSTHWIFWDKTGNIRFKNPYSDGELIWTNFNYRIVKKIICIQQGFISDSKGKRFHPTQKPLRLIIELLENYSKENEIILDPFLGSGTTAVACERLNRRWIGIEINPEYCKITKERILKEGNIWRLF